MMRQFHSRRKKLAGRRFFLKSLVGTVCCLSMLKAGEPPVHSEKPNVLIFPPQEAKFVRFVIRATNSGNQGCLDELEVYGPDGKRNLALARQGGKASASSCLANYPQHAVEHLNDGRYGNSHSWIPAGTGEEWAQIELPEKTTVAQVVFSRDRLRQYGDRVPTEFEVRLSLDGQTWKTVRQVVTQAVSGAVGGGGSAVPSLPLPPPPPRFGPDGRITAVAAPGQAQVPPRDDLGFPNLALNPQAQPAASSLLPGFAIHQIAHLNDGLGGNSHSWIGAANPSWVEIDLGDVYWIYRVAFASDRSGQFNDRAATAFSILVATAPPSQTLPPSAGAGGPAGRWKTVFQQADGAPVQGRTEFKFKPVPARWVRIAIEAGLAGPTRIDEIEIFGQKDPIPWEKIGPLSSPYEGKERKGMTDEEEQLHYAFLGEEHAWLKTYGWADLDPSLVPYNGRVKEYPRHVEDDCLPLPPLSSVPTLDGHLEDPGWTEASRGVVRVAFPYDFEAGPLVEQEVWAGRRSEDLYLAIRTDRLLSSHVAVVSSADWQGWGVVALTPEGLVFNTYTNADGNVRLERTTPLEGAFELSQEGRSAAPPFLCELRLPLAWFPGCQEVGLRVGLGLGGRHTSPLGRPVQFVFSPLSIAEQGSCMNRTFQVRLAVPLEAGPASSTVTVSGNAPGLESGLTLAPGQAKTLLLLAQPGALGPEYELTVEGDKGATYSLHLFRYDPLERTLALMAELVDRMARKGLPVEAERRQLDQFRQRHEQLLAAPPQPVIERSTFFQARLAKRRLFFREPALAPLDKILFVKRHAYHPSHIYTDYTDAPFRPGGGIFILEIPRQEGRWEPGKAQLTQLFEAGEGIGRDPVATFDLRHIYFGYRPSADGFFHILRMNADGAGLQQLTDGPYHDFYPCPLPDGGIAFITTRCAARVFCFRWTASVLFRMDAEGHHMRPLSFASLSEWAPSVMRDGRIIWTRWEYLDKGADFSQTLWSIHPDGTQPELVFGNTIIQPNGYACGREVPGTSEICCTLVSHFGDLNGPIALLDPSQGRFNPQAITSLTPEVPWPGMWPATECFRDPVPLARDYFLCSHAPRDTFGLYVIDRFGNRELLYLDPTIGSMAPTPFRVTPPPHILPGVTFPPSETGRLLVIDVYQGLEPTVVRGRVKWLRVVEEVRHDLSANPNFDHVDFMKWYASPVDLVSGPFGWPAYVAKAPLGIVPVEEDGSAYFSAPAGKTLYFQALDEDFNELQRMRSVVQLQPGETRTCIGCHEERHTAPPVSFPMAETEGESKSANRQLHFPWALKRPLQALQPPPWGGGPFSYEQVVQPVLDRHCVQCHPHRSGDPVDLTGTLDRDRVPASYRTLITQGWVHFVDCGWNSGGCEKRAPLTFGTVQSKLWPLLGAGHHGVELSREEKRRIKCWTDLNCPLWPDYLFRPNRPGPPEQVTQAP